MLNISLLGSSASDFPLTDLILVSSSNVRLVEVNGVPVVDATAKDLTELLQKGPSAQIVVLRHPLVGPASPHHPPPPVSNRISA